MNSDEYYKYMKDGLEKKRGQYLCVEPADSQKQTEYTVGNETVDGQNYHFYTEKYNLSQNGLPWSPYLLWIFHKTYGVPLKNNLKCLFFDAGDYRRIRYCYWRLIRDLYADDFMRLLGENNRVFTETSGNAGVLLLDITESEWLLLPRKTVNELSELRSKMQAVIKRLEGAQIKYHLGDDRIMQRYATVEKGKLVIGTLKYSVVIVPPCDCLGDLACKLLEVFKREGGRIIFVERVPKYLAGFKSDRFERIAEGCEMISVENFAVAVINGLKEMQKGK